MPSRTESDAVCVVLPQHDEDLRSAMAIASRHGVGILPRGGQDGAAIQRSRSGVRSAFFACPIKYIHTVTEVAHKDDLESYVALLAAFLETC